MDHLEATVGELNAVLSKFMYGDDFSETKRLVELLLLNEQRKQERMWSTQGLGMLRLYLDPEQRFRLHIWDGRLKTPAASPLHDHPWNFDSVVIAGRVKQFRFERWIKGDNREEYNLATIKCGEGAVCTSEISQVALSRKPFELYVEGQIYHQGKSEIHESIPDHGTVTLVERTFEGDREAAHVYWPGKGPFVSAEPRPATKVEIQQACEYALNTWF